jgi:hypothetical protein
MAHKVTIKETPPTRPGVTYNTLREFRIYCDKCGLIDKAGNMQSAKSVAARHENFPHR